MVTWEYRTLIYGTPAAAPGSFGRFRGVRHWAFAAPTHDAASVVVGESEQARFVGKLWQANRLLESALAQLDREGWELVSASFSGLIGLYGTAIVKRRDRSSMPEHQAGAASTPASEGVVS